MHKVVFVFFALLSFYTGFSQRYDPNFMYGKMVKEGDTLVGYFRFSHELTQNGQPVQYKKDSTSEKTKTFPSRRYDYFESDSLYLETFGVVPMLTGDVLIMIPRIVNGKIQLFAVSYNGGGFFNLGSSSDFFVKKGDAKIKLKKSKFKKQMKLLLDDDVELMQKIESEELKYEDIVKIVLMYNYAH